MAGPIDNVYVDGVAVQKGNVRSDDKTGHRRTMASVNDVRNADLTGQFGGIYVSEMKQFYDLDTDNLDADDGDEVIIDFAGNHFVKLDLGSGSADSAVQSVVAGTNVTVDNTDPRNPVVSAASGGGGSASEYATIAEVEAATVPGSLDFLRTAGFSAVGDLGGALYKRVGSEPAHVGKVQSADGAWWEISEPALRPQMFGDGDSTFANADAVALAQGGLPVENSAGVSHGSNFGSAMTGSGEEFGQSFRNSSVTGNDVYDAIFPGVDVSDGIQSVVNIPSGSAVESAVAIAGYVKNDGAENGVSIAGYGVGTVANSHNWGLNTLLQDNATRATHARSGQTLTGAEFDFNVMSPNTQVIGASVGGNSLAQSTNAIGYIVNSLGNGNKWQTGLFLVDGAVSEYGVVLGADAATGTSRSSLKILQQYFNASSAKKTLTMQASDSAWTITNDDTNLTVKIGGSIAPNANDGGAIGSASLQWSDLYLASGAVVNYANGNVRITHSSTALSYSGANYLIYEWNATSGDSVNVLFRKSNGTAGAKTIVAAADAVGKFLGQGYNGTGYDSAAQITFEIDGTPGASNDMPGRIVFWVSADGTASLGEALRISNDKSLLAKSSIRSDSATGGIGYATGAGGSVTQATSRTTGVTLNKVSGAITLFTAAGSATAATFTVTNSAVAATDTISLSVKSATNKYAAVVSAVGNGSFDITFWALNGTSSDAPVINFNIVKGVAA